MKIETLREFVEFSKYQNLSTAAKKLFMSQPALSNHIANLEKDIGVKLLRRGKSLELTAAGRAFFEGCCEVLGHYDSVLDKVKALAKEGEQGTLAIKMAFNDGGGSVKLAEWIGAFKRVNPGATIRVLSDSKNTVMEDLVSGRVDCAQMFNYSPQQDETNLRLDFLVIDNVPITIAACKDHPLMERPSVAFEDILEYPYAMPAGAPFEECHLSVQQIYRDNGYELKNIHFKVVDSLTDLIFMETKGLEVLLLGPAPTLPSTMLYRNFSPEVTQEFCLVYRRDSSNQLLASFIEFIRDQLDRYR